MNLRIAICDDSKDDIKLEINVIKSCMHSVVKDFEIKEFGDSNDFMEHFNELIEYDVILLDIDMPDISGIEIANRFVKEGSLAKIIFITNRSDLVFDAIHCGPFRFVRKEKMHDELSEAMIAVCKKVKNELLLYEFCSGKDNIKIRVIDIIYIESKNHYIHIHTNNQVKVIRGKISDYEKKLEGFGFIRVHQGFLVNVRSIFTITSKGVTLDSGEQLPISRKRVDEIKEIHLNYVRRFVRGIY